MCSAPALQPDTCTYIKLSLLHPLDRAGHPGHTDHPDHAGHPMDHPTTNSLYQRVGYFNLYFGKPEAFNIA
jgi:hypothetical protein